MSSMRVVSSDVTSCHSATTLYDKPPSIFRETPLELRHELFLRLAQTLPAFSNR